MKNIQKMTIIMSLVMGSIGISSPLITLYLQALGASFATISLILTTYAAILMGSNYIWGHISDFLGKRKPLIFGGLLSMSLALVLLSRVPDANWAWGVRIFEAISLAAYNTISLALMGDILASEEKRGRRMGIYRGIGSFAFAAGAIVGGRLADQFSMSTSLTLSAGLYFLAAMVALTLYEPKSAPVPSSPHTPNVAKESASTMPQTAQRPPLLFLGGVLFWVAAHGASASMWPNYMDSLGFNKTTISSMWGLAAAVEGVAMPLVGNLSDLIGRAPLLVAGALLIAIVQIGYITVARFLPALGGVQIIRGFGFASYTTTAMTFASEIGNKHIRGGNTGTFNAAAGSGQLLGALAGGMIVEALGFKVLFGVCSAMALISAVCFILLQQQMRRKTEPAVEPV